MSDRKRIIERLEECLSASCRGFRTCPYSDDEWDAVKTALALLKEQKNCENCAIAIEDRQPVVRCKDCMYWDADEHMCNDKLGWYACNADWFCADGERKEEHDATKG